MCIRDRSDDDYRAKVSNALASVVDNDAALQAKLCLLYTSRCV